MTVQNKPKLYKTLVHWFVIAGLAGSFFSLVIAFFMAYQSARNLVFINLASSRDQQAQLINIWFEERSGDIKQLAFSPALRQQDLPGARTLLEDYFFRINNEFDTFILAGKDGHVLIDASEEESTLYVGDRDYFLQALRGQDAVSEVLISRKDGTPVVVVASPVFSYKEEVTGVVFGTLSLDRIDRFISSFRFGQTGETYLVDDMGIMLTESRFTPLLIKRGEVRETTKYRMPAHSPLVKKVTAGGIGCGEHVNYRDTNALAAYRWIEDRNWGLIVEIEKSEVLGNWFNTSLIVLTGLLFVLALIILPLARHLSGRIVVPLTKITEKIGVFTENYKSDILSWSALDSPDYQELAVLSDSFYQMGEKISQLMDRLESQAQYDVLTGLANRLHFFERGHQIIELIQRNARTCALLFLDIDNFKKINDTYGHSVGDEALVSLARLFEKSVRISDVVGRLGGEEFTVIMPDTDEEGAKILAERLRHNVETTPVRAGDLSLQITVSIGIAVYFGSKARIDGKDVLEQLIKRADAAMYKAKQKGRNRVEVYLDDYTQKNQLKIFLDDQDKVM